MSDAVPRQPLSLPPEPASARAARRYVGDRFSDLGMSDDAVVAELLVSELVTNALVHANSAVTVSVEPREGAVRVVVADQDPHDPILRDDVQGRVGRGLILVDRMATQWGVERSGTGKVVWFELPRQSAATHDELNRQED